MSLYKNRCVVDFIPRMLKIIPKEEFELINDLNQYRNSLWNQAPEVTRSAHCWNPLQSILTNHIKRIDDEWKIELVKIFNGKE
jgi:hypothetical protein